MAVRAVRDAQLAADSVDPIAVRRLDWDTAFFGRTMGALARTGEVETRAVDVRAALQRATDQGYAHVIFRVSGGDFTGMRAAQEAGMRLVDLGVDLGAHVGRHQPLTSAASVVRPVLANELHALHDIADEAFTQSRFIQDPFFTSSQVRAFFRQWVTNLCEDPTATVLAAYAGDEIAGFVSCRREGSAARIPLIATSEGHRRQGIGRALLAEAFGWTAAAGLSRLRVKTQAANYPALALYERMGFVSERSELTFSARLA